MLLFRTGGICRRGEVGLNIVFIRGLSNDVESKVKQFRRIPVDRTILEYLDAHGLGYNARRKDRVRVAKLFEDNAKYSKSDVGALPYPFFLKGVFMAEQDEVVRDLPSRRITNPNNSGVGEAPRIALIGNALQHCLCCQRFLAIYLLLSCHNALLVRFRRKI